MASRPRFFSGRSSCSYLPDQSSKLEYEDAPDLTSAEYADRLRAGWRRFGTSLFRPRCGACHACRSLRVDVARFRPDRSQRRNRTRNEAAIDLRIGEPRLTREKLRLYDRFHAFQADTKGWGEHIEGDAFSYAGSFVANPIPTEEWCYFLDGDLVGVGYADVMPGVGLSAIYFIHEPDHRDRGLGTWNVLRLIEECRIRGLPHLYLGYFVEGCRSLEYKGRFLPNQVVGPDGAWADFRG